MLDCSFLMREISSATLFSSVAIHFELIPKGESIMSPQKNLANARPIIEFLEVCVVQFMALVLSVILKTTGYGSSVNWFVDRATNAAQ